MTKEFIGTSFEVGKRYIYPNTGLIVECKYAYEGEIYYAMFAEVIVEDSINHRGRHYPFSGPSWKEYKEPRTITRWVNVYERYGELYIFSDAGVYYSKEDAERSISGYHSDVKYVATIPITYTEPL